MALDLTGEGNWQPAAAAAARGGAEIDLTRTLSSEAAGCEGAVRGASGGGDAGAIDLSGPDLMAEARHLSSIFPDLRPANILAVLMDFQDHHDDPVAVVSSLLSERTSLGPESLAQLPKPSDVSALGVSAFSTLQDALTTLLGIFPNADPSALRTALSHKQEEGIADLVGAQSAEMLEGYVRVSDAAALSSTATVLPHELPFDMEEFLPAEEDSYEARTMLKGLRTRPSVDMAHAVPGWDRFLASRGENSAGISSAERGAAAAATSLDVGYCEWVEYALSGRFPMVSLPHIRATLAELGDYTACWGRLRSDIVLHGGIDFLGGDGEGVGGGGKKRKRKGGSRAVLLRTARKPGGAPGGDLPDRLRLEAIFCEHRNILLDELCKRWDRRNLPFVVNTLLTTNGSTAAESPAASDGLSACGGNDDVNATGQAARPASPMSAAATVPSPSVGVLVECLCCYDEVPQIELGVCSGNRHHAFCLECVCILPASTCAAISAYNRHAVASPPALSHTWPYIGVSEGLLMRSSDGVAWNSFA